MRIVSLPGVIAINATMEEALKRFPDSVFPLAIMDPPYGDIVSDEWDKATADDYIRWTSLVASKVVDAGAIYAWGGTGRPGNRVFFEYLSRVERECPPLEMSLITWAKKRAYGIDWNYLYCREEVAYLCKGTQKKPRQFVKPLLDKKRGYAGYDEKYPAHSEFLRRTNVWQDITEIMRGKVTTAEKPEALHEIPILAHTQPGEVVLDPFASSMSVARACRKLGRKCIAIEASPIEFEKGLATLQEGWTR
jgi:DNA modification methylase